MTGGVGIRGGLGGSLQTGKQQPISFLQPFLADQALIYTAMEPEIVQIVAAWMQDGFYEDEVASLAFTCRTAHQTLEDSLKAIADLHVEEEAEWRERGAMEEADFDAGCEIRGNDVEVRFTTHQWLTEPVLLSRLFGRD